jgi:hypothetical protein
VLDFLDVRAANPAGRDAKQNFAVANFGNGDGLYDDPAFAAIDSRAHVAERANWPVRCVDCGGCAAHLRFCKIAIRSRLEIFRSFHFNRLPRKLIARSRLEIGLL